jgi:hypothetical protein
VEKEKDPAGMIGPLIHWAIMFVRYDRKIARRSGCIDVYDYRSRMARQDMDGQGKARPADRSDPGNGWIDWGLEAGDDPAELAAALEQARVTLEQFLAA